MFVKYLNSYYYINHKVLLDIVDSPYVYGDYNQPAFGIFYPYYNLFKIRVANDMEFYRNQVNIGKKKSVYFVLHTIAHEIYHYFQYSENKKTIENWVEHQAHKILRGYVKECPNHTILTINYVSRDDIVKDLAAANPYKE